MPARKPGLTAKRERFAAEYLLDLNATQAAIRAGYSAKTAYQIGHELLRNADVDAAIQKGRAEAVKRAELTLDEVIAELRKPAFANMLDYVRVTAEGDAYVDLSKLTRDQAAAISEITVEDFKDGRGENARDVRRVKFKLHDKIPALVKLGQHMGGFKEQHEHSGAVGHFAVSDKPLTADEWAGKYANGTGKPNGKAAGHA